MSDVPRTTYGIRHVELPVWITGHYSRPQMALDERTARAWATEAEAGQALRAMDLANGRWHVWPIVLVSAVAPPPSGE